jgi:hypothetical protein
VIPPRPCKQENHEGYPHRAPKDDQPGRHWLMKQACVQIQNAECQAQAFKKHAISLSVKCTLISPEKHTAHHKLDHYCFILYFVEKVKREISPRPNFMQISSSTMHIARESQQKAPTFFTGLLMIKIIAKYQYLGPK